MTFNQAVYDSRFPYKWEKKVLDYKAFEKEMKKLKTNYDLRFLTKDMQIEQMYINEEGKYVKIRKGDLFIELIIHKEESEYDI